MEERIFLFCFSESGAEASAILYSKVETAYANNLRVKDYLSYVFKTMPTINPRNRHELAILLPYSVDFPSGIKIKEKNIGIF
ncbi:MAG: hypothetical protein PHN54_03435 [Bacilli bacterium]|nr:hypothetical protein [Bacilli bacterium]